MDVEQVKRYEGKNVLLILKNNFKFTIVIPDFSGSSFTAKDKFSKPVTIECDMISMIYEKNSDDNDK